MLMKWYLLKLQFDGWGEMGRHPLCRLRPDIHGLLHCGDAKLNHDGVCVPINYLLNIKQ